jgi:hypothetical protein
MTVEFVRNAERLVRDVDGRREVWRAEVHGQPVTAEIHYAEFEETNLASRGAMPFRDYVIAQLVRAAGIQEAA